MQVLTNGWKPSGPTLVRIRHLEFRPLGGWLLGPVLYVIVNEGCISRPHKLCNII